MINDLISRKALINALFVRNGKKCPDTDVDNFPITINVKDVKEAIRNAPTAYDVDKVVRQINEEIIETPEYKNKFCESVEVEHCTQHNGCEDCMAEMMIEIVKSGGIR